MTSLIMLMSDSLQSTSIGIDGIIRRISLFILLLGACSTTSLVMADRVASSAFVSHVPRLGHQLTSASHHAITHDSALSSTPALKETSDRCTHIYIRFSPLVGGPIFLPLHVEVIFVVDDATTATTPTQTHTMDTVYIRNSESFSSVPFFNNSMIFHRFDFLPANPTDPSTLARLFTFQSVPGVVRCRSISQQDANDESVKITDRNGFTILIPVGSHMCRSSDNTNSNDDDIVSTAVRFKDEYGDNTFKEIRLLGGKNCFSFALDLLSYVESATGFKRVTALATLDIT
jgi:hypothetical protein